MALATNDAEDWELYLKYVACCWQGEVGQVIEKLQPACDERGLDWRKAEDGAAHQRRWSPRCANLSNNRAWMNYPQYHRDGLPVTSAPMESLIKQINQRVKGTKMFWDDPEGAEAILQLRSGGAGETGG